jgi:hypothetical protein
MLPIFRNFDGPAAKNPEAANPHPCTQVHGSFQDCLPAQAQEISSSVDEGRQSSD